MFLKRFLSLVIILLSFINHLTAQKMDSYPANWKKIAELEKKGLTTSALKEVLTIFDLALAAGNDAQQIKAAMYQMKYRNMVEQDNAENNILFIDTLIAKAKSPAKNMLQSMQASLYWNYRQNNRYEIFNRTKLAEEKSNDISTWSIEKMNKTISTLYKASLKNESLLKSTSLDGLDAILEKGINTRYLRPTIYDFLAHEALAYFMDDENSVTQPAYKFILNDENIFAPVNLFIKNVFTTKDSTSLHFNALLLFQDILKFHITDNNADALIDADLERLSFANEHGIFTNKEKLYEDALKKVESNYSNNPATAQAIYLRAENLYEKGKMYDPFTHKDVQFDIRKAMDLCEDAINKFPKSYGAINCQNLIAEIKTPLLSLETEKINVPDQPFRSLIKYKNTRAVYLRVIKIDREQLKLLIKDGNDKLWQSLSNLKDVKSWVVNLPDQQDYQEHSTEIKVDALPMGNYILLASLRPDFNGSNNLLAMQVLYVSNISYILNSKQELYVVDRDNGQPLANASLQLVQRAYNNTSRMYEEIKKEKYTADKNGFIKIKNRKNNNDNYNYFQLNYKADELFTDDNYYNYQYNERNIAVTNSFLFTDRSIYRPGQTVFFKGIVIRKDSTGRKNTIVANYKTTVTLFNPNSEKVADIKVISNEYGSYNGNFKLPADGLNGQFYISDSAANGIQYFNVEEYKRPKFFVEIKKPAGTYRVNDSVQVTGTAKAYAGNNIDGAAVSYRIVRKVQYPDWWGWGYSKRWPPYNQRDEMEITNGKTTTDKNGEFTVNFKAIADETVDKRSQPVFYYEISTDITDVNGETRSGNTAVAVSYQALQLDIIIPEKISVDSLKNIKISSTNTNGIFEKTTMSFILEKLKSPNRIYRGRFWEVPDQFVMTKEEYLKTFPYDVYADENEISKWAIQQKVLEVTDTSAANSVFNIRQSAFEAGWYKITVRTKDKYGEEVKAEKYIHLQDEKKNVTDEAITINVKKAVAMPGEKINYTVSTAFEKIWLIHSIDKMDNTTYKVYPLITNTHAFNNEIDVKESDRGGVNLGYAFVQHNRLYQDNLSISIPWNNKDLDISYETFRDKILPGSTEKWKIKISGNKAEKIAAETLISMYDASLDQFKAHDWNSLKSIWPTLPAASTWQTKSFISINSQVNNNLSTQYITLPVKTYDALLNNGWKEPYYLYDRRDDRVNLSFASAAPIGTMKEKSASVARGGNTTKKLNRNAEADENKTAVSDKALDIPRQGNSTQGQNPIMQVRKNFNETAFFFPALQTDPEGNISFSFTIPEALTSWKMMTLAHNKELASAYSEKMIITQKPLMVQPNPTRFLREADRMEFSAKVVNLSDSEITGTVQLELFDAATNKAVDGWFKNIFPVLYFTVAASQSTVVQFPIDIPVDFNSALTWRIKAISKDGSFSDGEEAALPVLTNRMLVTETMPLNMRNQTTKSFKFEKLLTANNSGSLTNHALTVEYSSNPAWYAIQALPYLMEYPYECAVQSFNRYYANALASYVCNATPKIKAVFDKWLAGNGADSAALLSNLQKNESLKSALLQETPWVLEAKDEATQKKNIAVLFDLVRLAKEKDNTLAKLKEMQTANGGFSWFKGGPDDRYITQYIVSSIGHLHKLKALSIADDEKLQVIIDKALPYLDARLKEEYDELKKQNINLKQNNLSALAIHYLYMRSFFTEKNISTTTQTAYRYYRGQAQQYWLSNSKYLQAMIALALYRTDDNKIPQAIIKSLKENAIYKEETGMYFKEFTNGGYYWYQSPIESQALMIEAFSDIDKDNITIDDLKTWLLKQKQTQNWKTTRATAEACYALLLNGSNWLAEEKEVTIQLGNKVIKSTDQQTASGTGYFKKMISADDIQQGMGNIQVTVTGSSKQPVSKSASWGAVYWQYFEDLDKITAAETALKLVKKLFIEKNTDRGPELQPLKEGEELHVGDKIKVRIELKADRDMEYVHMKDMRAACMEPVNVISEYKWQGGLGYYESTKDASTNFFFSWLTRGTYVFEYPMFVTHTGNFSNGITTIQCMYAPEFSSHSEGIRVNVE